MTAAELLILAAGLLMLWHGWRLLRADIDAIAKE